MPLFITVNFKRKPPPIKLIRGSESEGPQGVPEVVNQKVLKVFGVAVGGCRNRFERCEIEVLSS